MNRAEILRESIKKHCTLARISLQWKDGINRIQGNFALPMEGLSDTHLNQATLIQLFELERQANDFQSTMNHSAIGMKKALIQLEDDYDHVQDELQLWRDWQTLAQARQAAPDILGSIVNVQAGLSDSQQALITIRNELLRDLAQLGESGLRVSALKAEIASRRSETDRQIRMAAGDYLWNSKLSRQDWKRIIATIGAQFQAQRSALIPYYRDHGILLTSVLISFGLFCFSLLRTARMRSWGTLQRGDEEETSVVHAVLNRPYSAAFSFALLALALIAPMVPAAFYDVINIPMLLAALMLGYELRGKEVLISLAGVTVAVIPILYWGVLDHFPELDRWVLLFQSISMIVCLSWDFRRGHWYRAAPEVPATLVRWILMAIMVSLLIGLPANVLGYVGIARVTIWSSIVVFSDTLVWGGVGCVVYTLLAISLRSAPARQSRLLKSIHASLLRWSGYLLTTGVILYVILRILSSYGLFDPLLDGLTTALKWNAPMGQHAITVAQGLTAFAVLLATWWIIKLLGLLLEEEIFPRLSLPLGLPFAISSLSRYLVGLLGLILAMQTLGFDLTQVTLLAGALGVGIGFGLQNIFNNFASGLILLIERPMNVGDVIENGKLIGIVRRIGIRSSTIRTLQGAEVILPNAELIAKPVINWTLSDRLRRMEIDIAVEAQDAKVEVVVPILEAAARDSGDVLKEPPPYALVTGFGDGNLNFRLCAWINRYEDESRIASRVRHSILKRFEAAGVKIPDPLSAFAQQIVNPTKGAG